MKDFFNFQHIKRHCCRALYYNILFDRIFGSFKNTMDNKNSDPKKYFLIAIESWKAVANVR